MNKKLLVSLMLLLSMKMAIGQAHVDRCGTMEVDHRLRLEDPSYAQNREQINQFTQQWVANHPEGLRTVITIPVVFHVVWNTTAENLSDAQIQSQLDVLNEDFRRLNSDMTETRAAFAGVAADCEINFCLAVRDPAGNATNGIIHKNTATTSFTTNDNVKKSNSGGDDAWDRNSYLNIWTCDLSGSVIGYAQFPGGSAATDGVVLDYAYTGRGGSADAPFDLGRSGTHEVGHWLNLFHIWGDDGNGCNGSDQVGDTPNQANETYFCPLPTIRISCTNEPNGDMYENYMDYTDDACMNMFSAGQKARMQALFVSGGSRFSITSSQGCVPPGVACAVPGGLTSSSITTTSALTSWNTATGATSYKVKYKPTSSGTWLTVTSTSTSKSLTGLTSGTPYDFKVKSVCSGGTSSAFSPVANFTTLSGGGCPDILEPNNGKATAAAISTGTDYNALIANSTDADWYSFTNSASQPNIRVSLTSLPNDFDVKLFNPSGTSVATSENSATEDETINYNTAVVGTYKVKVYGYDGLFDAADCYVLNIAISNLPFKLSEGDGFSSGNSEINLYPNPAQNNLTVLFKSTGGVDVQFNVYNMMGQLMTASHQQAIEGSNTFEQDISSLQNGFFIVEMINGDEVVRQKFEVAR